MEEFDIKRLVHIQGMPGLYKIKTTTNIRDSVLVERLTMPGKIQPVNYKKNQFTPLGSTVIYYIEDGQRRSVPVEEVIERMYDLEISGEMKRADMDKSCDLIGLMELVVPSYDMTEFKPYHMQRLLKWYAEIRLALDMLGDDDQAGSI